jgi:hypothetical protein
VKVQCTLLGERECLLVVEKQFRRNKFGASDDVQWLFPLVTRVEIGDLPETGIWTVVKRTTKQNRPQISIVMNVYLSVK